MTVAAVNSRRRGDLLGVLWFAVAVAGFAPAVGATPPPFVPADGELPSLAPMLDQATIAVVNIATESTVRMRRNPLLDDPFFRRFFNVPDLPRERKAQSLGSGVIIDAQRGIVITNNHVIANADQITVKLNDGRTFAAELVGTDPDTDVAVIRIPPEGLGSIALADSDRLRVGDYVVAIGNPFGLEHTVTSGIVSALARSGLGIGGYEDYIQTDASINPGNSGGALVNLRGELVGINTAIFSQSGGNIGIGFAIPINMARAVADQLLQFGEVKRGFVGAQMQDLDPELATAFGVGNRKGAVVVDVSPDSPADEAGLKPGDVIVGVNGKEVANAADVRNRVGLLRIGERVTLDLVRNGKRLQVHAEVAEPPSGAQAGASLRNPLLAGSTFADIDESHPLYGRAKGVMVGEVERDSALWRAGVRAGDIVLSVNRQPIENLNGFLALVSQHRGPLLFQIRRGNAVAFMIIK
ncbi:MAG: DegQ family serine endoprotease [Gammaproteobacteria bacterium]|nr:DegQ family serine endoprotease [Gammaproteobacteria bacterium]